MQLAAFLVDNTNFDTAEQFVYRHRELIGVVSRLGDRPASRTIYLS